ncbi:MAG: enolase C-terminal domain-like protein [Bryobacteraceae bacterium]
MKISSVRVHTATMSHSWLTESLIAHPLAQWSAYREKRTSWFGTMSAGVVEIETDAGLSGLGFIGGGKANAARTIIDDQFSQLLIGQDPADIERLWEQMYRASVMYGRRGVAIEAISGIDLALWDLLGKACGQPVYKLIGGQTKDRLPAYVTGNLTERHLKEGFRDVKIALPHGPADGEDGLRGNEEIMRRTREFVGPDGDIMLDCYMALTVPYAIELVKRLQPYKLRWIEEPLLPDDIDGLLRIKDATGVTISGGEHEYTRFGFRELIERRALDLLQPDIYRAGGLTELRKIAAMASAYHLPVIPHGVGAPTYHFVMATPNSPKAEFVDVFAQGGELMLEGEPIPRNGFIELPATPGFGYTLNQRALAGDARIAPIW